MSGAEQFKADVTSVSGPDQGWRGGLERSRARGAASNVGQENGMSVKARPLKANRLAPGEKSSMALLPDWERC
jgi:hypothetical protein